MQRAVKAIVQELATEYGLSAREVEEIVAAPWRHMKQELVKLREKEINNIEDVPIFSHFHLGSFQVMEKKFNKFKEKLHEKRVRPKND